MSIELTQQKLDTLNRFKIPASYPGGTNAFFTPIIDISYSLIRNVFGRR